jgi:hypothetical protein
MVEVLGVIGTVSGIAGLVDVTAKSHPSIGSMDASGLMKAAVRLGEAQSSNKMLTKPHLSSIFS